MWRALTVTEMTLRAILRDRLPLALLLLLPLAFYLVRHDQSGQAVRFLGVGLAWATSTVALFAAIAARPTEPRLRIAGWSQRELLAGRVAALFVVAAGMASAYALLVLADRPVDRTGAVALMLGVTGCTGVSVGSALGALVSRGLEGALLLFIVAGLQFIADPSTPFAHLLPFWSTRELATYAVDGSNSASLGGGLGHAGAISFICIALAAAVCSAGTRRRRRVRADGGR